MKYVVDFVEFYAVPITLFVIGVGTVGVVFLVR